jgi:hypothetical protein
MIVLIFGNFVLLRKNQQFMFKKILILLNFILFFSEIPYIFSPEIKKNSFFISIAVSILACMRFVGVIGLKNERKWGMEILILVPGVMSAFLIFIRNIGFFLAAELIMFFFCMLFGLFSYKQLKRGI